MSEEDGGHVRDIAMRQAVDGIDDHGNLNGKGGQSEAGTDLIKVLNRKLLLLGIRADHLGDQIEERFYGSAAFLQVLSDVREAKEAMIGLSKATFDLFLGRCEQGNTLCGPTSKCNAAQA